MYIHIYILRCVCIYIYMCMYVYRHVYVYADTHTMCMSVLAPRTWKSMASGAKLLTYYLCGPSGGWAPWVSTVLEALAWALNQLTFPKPKYLVTVLSEAPLHFHVQFWRGVPDSWEDPATSAQTICQTLRPRKLKQEMPSILYPKWAYMSLQ